MAPIERSNPASVRSNVLAGANTVNRKVLYEEVEQVTALRTALDAQYRGARRPGLPGLFARAFASAGTTALELPAPPLPRNRVRHAEPRDIQLSLRALVQRHGSTEERSDQESAAGRLLNLLEHMSRNYQHLENRVALARRG